MRKISVLVLVAVIVSATLPVVAQTQAEHTVFLPLVGKPGFPRLPLPVQGNCLEWSFFDPLKAMSASQAIEWLNSGFDPEFGGEWKDSYSFLYGIFVIWTDWGGEPPEGVKPVHQAYEGGFGVFYFQAPMNVSGVSGRFYRLCSLPLEDPSCWTKAYLDSQLNGLDPQTAVSKMDGIFDPARGGYFALDDKLPTGNLVVWTDFGDNIPQESAPWTTTSTSGGYGVWSLIIPSGAEFTFRQGGGYQRICQ